MRYIACLALTMSLAAGVAAQKPVEESRFEVVSVRPLRPEFRGGYNATPSSFTASMPVSDLMTIAYPGVNQIVGLPDWARGEPYAIKAATPAVRQRGDLGPMVRHMLEDRFALRVHTEIRPIPVFVLTIDRRDGRPGPALRPVQRACSAEGKTRQERCGTGEGLGELQAYGTSWSLIVATLRRFAGRPIVDRTGLSGQFDYELKWNHEGVSAPPGMSLPSDMESRATFFTAIREQLGLKLEADKAPMEVLVVDRLERPTPN